MTSAESFYESVSRTREHVTHARKHPRPDDAKYLADLRAKSEGAAARWIEARVRADVMIKSEAIRRQVSAVGGAVGAYALAIDSGLDEGR